MRSIKTGKQPVLGDSVEFKFAGKVRVGTVQEIVKTQTGKQWVVICKNIVYPCLTLDKSKLNYIIGILI